MIVGSQKRSVEGGELCVSAEVRTETSSVELPPVLWFRYPESYDGFVNERSDAFAAAALLTAMLLGEERLVVEGPVSARLAHGLREYQTAYHQWWPRTLSRVRVEYAEVTPGGGRRGDGVGCLCSGGVDSFYSFFKHLPANEDLEDARITHGLIVNGFNFDWDLDRSREFQRVYETYAPLLKRNGVELLRVRQNVQNFLFATGGVAQGRGPMSIGLQCAIVSLSPRFRRFYIPSAATYRYAENYPHNFHPSIMHLLSTEETDVFFDGGDASRAEKTEAITAWDDTRDALRVCWRPTVFDEKTGLVENCGRCPKCVRTMITLDLLGVLPKYRTFPGTLDRARVRRSHWMSANEKVYYADLLALARRVGRPDVERDLLYGRFRSRASAAVRHRILRRKKPGAMP